MYSPSCGHKFIVLQALPDDLKTKLSIDEDIVSSPKEALSRVSAERVAQRNKNHKRLFIFIDTQTHTHKTMFNK